MLCAPSLPGPCLSFPCYSPTGFPHTHPSPHTSILLPPRPYFHTLQVAKRLFGVDVVPADGQAPVWHEDVRFFQLLKDGQPKAWFYLDPYSRCGGIDGRGQGGAGGVAQ